MKPLYSLHHAQTDLQDASPEKPRLLDVLWTLCDPVADAPGKGRVDGARGGGGSRSYAESNLRLGIGDTNTSARCNSETCRNPWRERTHSLTRKIILENFTNLVKPLLTFTCLVNILTYVTLTVRKNLTTISPVPVA